MTHTANTYLARKIKTYNYMFPFLTNFLKTAISGNKKMTEKYVVFFVLLISEQFCTRRNIQQQTNQAHYSLIIITYYY